MKLNDRFNADNSKAELMIAAVELLREFEKVGIEKLNLELVNSSIDLVIKKDRSLDDLF